MMIGRGAQAIYEEAEAHRKVGELLRRQRELMVAGKDEELGEVNQALIDAIGEAHAATQRRRRVLAELGMRMSQPMLGAAWAELRQALRMVKNEATLSEEMAGEMLADIQFLLGLLQPAIEGYGRDGRRYASGPALLDKAV